MKSFKKASSLAGAFAVAAGLATMAGCAPNGSEEQNGKYGSEQQSAQIEKIASIAAGAIVAYDHSVEVKGAIGKGANVKITHGGLKVHGNVEDNAVLDVKGGNTVIRGNGVTVITSSNSPIITGVSGDVTIHGNKVQINGQDVDTTPKGLSGVEIHGKTGHQVNITSSGSIDVADVGDGSILKSKSSISAQNLGNNVQASAGGSFDAFNVGAKAKLNAGGSIDLRDIGANSLLNAGGSVTAGKITPGTTVDAGGSITAKSADLNDLTAGGSVHVKTRAKAAQNLMP